MSGAGGAQDEQPDDDLHAPALAAPRAARDRAPDARRTSAAARQASTTAATVGSGGMLLAAL